MARDMFLMHFPQVTFITSPQADEIFLQYLYCGLMFETCYDNAVFAETTGTTCDS